MKTKINKIRDYRGIRTDTCSNKIQRITRKYFKTLQYSKKKIVKNKYLNACDLPKLNKLGIRNQTEAVIMSIPEMISLGLDSLVNSARPREEQTLQFP